MPYKRLFNLNIIIFVLILLFIEKIDTFGKNLIFSNSSNSAQIINLEKWNVENGALGSNTNIKIPFFIKNRDINSVSFQTEFDLPLLSNYSQAKLWITGLHGYTYVYLNKKLKKEHIWLTNTYAVDLDLNSLQKRGNILRIELLKTNEEGKSLDLRLPNYLKQYRPLGIAGEVFLELFPKKYIDNFNFNYSNNKFSFSYDLIITDSSKTNSDRTIKIEEEILSPDGLTIHKRFEYIKNQIIEKSFSRTLNFKNPSKWHTENPKLYTVILSANSGTKTYYRYKTKIGLRETKVENSELFINNKAIKIKGINYRYNFSNSRKYLSQSINDFVEIKKLGFNAVRFVNYVPHPSIANFADSIGLILFIDNGIWRLPDSFYSTNNYFNSGKLIIKEIGNIYKHHASVIAIGIGNEPNFNIPNVQKFTIVQKKYLNDNFNLLTYISPIDYLSTNSSEYSDMLIMQNYRDAASLLSISNEYNKYNAPIFLGNIHFSDSFQENENDHENNLYKLNSFLIYYDSSKVFNGYFIEAYNDWKADFPNLFVKVNEKNEIFYPFGIVDLHNQKTNKYEFFENYLHNQYANVIYSKPDSKNNFLSIIVFIVAILFFLIYKRSYRLKENLTRSIRHPYGFFVDLRDRRIISVFNSTLMGITIGTIISSFISAILHVHHTSVLFDEYVNIFISDFQTKFIFLDVVNSPWQLFLIIIMAISILQFIFVFIVKLIGLFTKEKRKIRQIFSIISWSGSPFLLFIPLAIFAQTMVSNNIFYPEIIWFFFLFLIWYNFRIANGFRILYLIPTSKMIVITILTYLIVIITFFAYINMDFETFDYIKTLSAAHNLY